MFSGQSGREEQRPTFLLSVNFLAFTKVGNLKSWPKQLDLMSSDAVFKIICFQHFRASATLFSILLWTIVVNKRAALPGESATREKKDKCWVGCIVLQL